MTQSSAKAKAPQKRTRSLRQIQRNEETRMQLLEAAGCVIGKHGYAGCTIARVTAKAKIAHGTFYLHFRSQQELFDQVLPVLGAGMLKVIAAAIRNSKDILDLERRGFEANFSYLSTHPHMYRVLAEAELYAPKAFQQYLDTLTLGYTRSLRRSLSSSLGDFSEGELETIAIMLIGARTYLLMRFGVKNHTVKPLRDDKIETYLKFVSHGIGMANADAQSKPSTTLAGF